MVEDVVGRAGDDGGVGTLDIGFITEKNIPVNLSLNIRLAPLSLSYLPSSEISEPWVCLSLEHQVQESLETRT